MDDSGGSTGNSVPEAKGEDSKDTPSVTSQPDKKQSPSTQASPSATDAPGGSKANPSSGSSDSDSDSDNSNNSKNNDDKNNDSSGDDTKNNDAKPSVAEPSPEPSTPQATLPSPTPAKPKPKPKPIADPKDDGFSSIVLQTLTVPGNFQGPTAALTTLTPELPIAPPATPTSVKAIPQTTPAQGSPQPPADVIPTALTAPSDGPVPTTLVQANTLVDGGTGTGSQPTPTAALGDVANQTPTGATADSGSSSPSAAGKSGSGSDGSAAKAGIALGCAAGVLLVVIAVWFFFFRRRKQKQRMSLEGDDEKINASFGNRGLKRMSLAPRLSLRPVAQALSAKTTSWNERRQSKNLDIATPPPAAAGSLATSRGGAWEQRGTATPSNNPDNPFGHYAERAITPPREEDPAEPVSPISATSRDQDDFPSNVSHVSDDTPPSTAVAPPPLARKTSTRKDGPGAIDLTRMPLPQLAVVPPSPAGTEYSMTSMSPGMQPGPSQSAAAIAAAGGPANSAVHRVQLDFAPSMADEMSLQVGQLVRLLHEYDDGWALCIRLDRSQQGVVPRTCLSVRPVKPRRPQGSPRTGPPVKPSMGPSMNHTPYGHTHPQALRPSTPLGRASPTQSGGTSSRSGSPQGDSHSPPAGPAPAPGYHPPGTQYSAPGVAY